MYDIRQFKPVLYLVVLLGISGFCVAGELPSLWIMSVGAIGLNAWLVKTGRFSPMPRMLANGLTLLIVGYVYTQIRTGLTPIIVIGQMLVLLQLVKLFEQRGNRDYAQILVLGLLLTVASAINTYSLIFGVMLVVYLFMALYCCLLFHLKIETDRARSADPAVLGPQPSPTMAMPHDRRLSSSLRRMTGVVAVVGITVAIGVFVLIPRGAGAGLINPMRMQASQRLTGFSDSVSFENVARIQQNNEVVGHLYVWEDDQPVTAGKMQYVRGTTLDTYVGLNPIRKPFQWVRAQNDERPMRVPSNVAVSVPFAPQHRGPVVRQRYVLEPMGTRVLFSLPGPLRMRSPNGLSLRYSMEDESFQLVETSQNAITYEVESTGQFHEPYTGTTHLWFSQIDPEVEQYARQLVGDRAGQRGAGPEPHPLDREIAKLIERHLQSEFTYTLDLTDHATVHKTKDPIVSFLYDYKEGHCEYFAGAMTLLCQSLGMEARMVIGFKVNEFNPMIGAYVIRQSHAHSWVEVRTPEGWETFDPTSAREAVGTRTASMMDRARQMYHFLEFQWANTVIGYDNTSDGNFRTGMNDAITNALIKGTRQDWRVKERISAVIDYVASRAVVPVVGLLVLVGLGAMVAYWVEIRRLRAAAKRIGLSGLTEDEQHELARQLRFYDQLLDVLQKRRITRPVHLTPREFSRSLTFLPPAAYRLVSRLTDVFYQVRFGNKRLSPARQRMLINAVRGLPRAF